MPVPDEGDHVAWSRFDYGPDETPNCHAFAAGTAAARHWAGRHENPFDPEAELGRFAEWDTGWLLAARELTAGARAAENRRPALAPPADVLSSEDMPFDEEDR